MKMTSDLPAPRDPSERATLELRESLVHWAAQDKVRNAWERMAEREGLDKEVFYSASWAFADGVACAQHENMLDMSKARRFGFFGTVDSAEDFLVVMRTAQELRFLPV